MALDCLRHLGEDRWAVHVPLGKLHTERLVPADPEVRRIMAPILALRALAPAAQFAPSQGLLLPRRGGHYAWYATLRSALVEAAQRAGCADRVTPHRLRYVVSLIML